MDYVNFDVDEYTVKQIQIIISTLLLVLNDNQRKEDEIKEIENILLFIQKNFDNNSYEYKFNIYDKLDKKNKAKLDEINSKYGFLDRTQYMNNVENERLTRYLRIGYNIKDKKYTIGVFSKNYKDINLKILNKIITELVEKERQREEEERERERRINEERIRKEKERREREEEERKRKEEERKRKVYLMKLERITDEQEVFSMSSSFIAYDDGEDETIEPFNFKAYYPPDEDKYKILISKYNRVMLDCIISSSKCDNDIIIYLKNNECSPEYKSEYEVLDDLDNFVIFNGTTNKDMNYFIQFKNLDLKSYKHLFIYLDSSGNIYSVNFKITFKFYNSDNKLPFETNLVFNKKNNKVNVENTVNANVENTVKATVLNTVNAEIKNTVRAKVTNLDSKYTTIF